MKIDDRKVALDPQLGGVPGVRDGGQPGPVGPRPGDRVSVSTTARELVRLRGDLGELDVLRQDRVLGLRAVMAKGHYSADFENVARTLLRELLAQLVV